MTDERTFTDIYNHVYQSSDGIRERVAGLAPDERVVWGMLAVLHGRKGFSYWWDTIGTENRDEIFEEMKAVARSG